MSDFDEKVKALEHGTATERAVALALRYGQIDGDWHKTWVIDQMVRVLAGAAYPELVRLYESEDEYEWDTGIAP